jgi:hypothetical protein
MEESSYTEGGRSSFFGFTIFQQLQQTQQKLQQTNTQFQQTKTQLQQTLSLWISPFIFLGGDN